ARTTGSRRRFIAKAPISAVVIVRAWPGSNLLPCPARLAWLRVSEGEDDGMVHRSGTGGPAGHPAAAAAGAYGWHGAATTDRTDGDHRRDPDRSLVHHRRHLPPQGSHRPLHAR